MFNVGCFLLSLCIAMLRNFLFLARSGLAVLFACVWRTHVSLCLAQTRELASLSETTGMAASCLSLLMMWLQFWSEGLVCAIHVFVFIDCFVAGGATALEELAFSHWHYLPEVPLCFESFSHLMPLQDWWHWALGTYWALGSQCFGGTLFSLCRLAFSCMIYAVRMYDR